MSCTNEMLVQLKNSNNMDFCADFANIQSILNYTHEYIKPLNKIQFRGGELQYFEEKKSTEISLSIYV